MDLKAFTVSVTDQNQVKLGSRNFELYLDERDMVIKFGVKIPKELHGKNSPESRAILQSFIYDYNNSLMLRNFFQEKLRKNPK